MEEVRAGSRLSVEHMGGSHINAACGPCSMPSAPFCLFTFISHICVAVTLYPLDLYIFFPKSTWTVSSLQRHHACRAEVAARLKRSVIRADSCTGDLLPLIQREHAQAPTGSGSRAARGRRGNRGFVGHADISDDEAMDDVPRYGEGTGVCDAHVTFAQHSFVCGCAMRSTCSMQASAKVCTADLIGCQLASGGLPASPCRMLHLELRLPMAAPPGRRQLHSQ